MTAVRGIARKSALFGAPQRDDLKLGGESS